MLPLEVLRCQNPPERDLSGKQENFQQRGKPFSRAEYQVAETAPGCLLKESSGLAGTSMAGEFKGISTARVPDGHSQKY